MINLSILKNDCVIDSQQSNHIIGMERILNSRLTSNIIEKSGKKSFTINGNEVVDFASGAYLGLNKDFKIQDFISLKKWGLRSSFSRASGQQMHMQILENAIGEDLYYQTVITAQSISLINLNVFITLKNVFKHFIIDEDAHSTLKNGINAAKINYKKFKNNNVDDLHLLLNNLPLHEKKIIVIDGVYSMSGAVAPLDRIYELAVKFNACILIDDAHGYGTLGEHGLGILEKYNLRGRNNIIYIGGFSKAFSNQVGFICIPKIYQRLFETSFNPGIFSGPPCNLNYIISLRHQNAIRSRKYRKKRERLLKNIEYFQKYLNDIGISVVSLDKTPIFAVRIKPEFMEEIADGLLKHGFYVKPAIFPVVKKGDEIIRITVLENHSKADINAISKFIEKNRGYFVSIS